IKHDRHWFLAPGRFQDVQSPLCIYRKILSRIRDRRGHRHLCCEMEYCIYILYRRQNSIEITYVTLNELQLFAVCRSKPIEIMLNTRAAKIIKKNNFVAIGQQPMGEICPNETYSTRYQGSHESSSLTPNGYSSWHSEQATT